MTEQAAQDGQSEQNTANTTDLASSVRPDYADMVRAKGWKSPDDVIASYTNMEKMAGKFSSRGVLIPDGDAPEEWGKVYDKLGRPEAPNGYEFSHIDTKDMDENGKQVMDFVKATGHELGLSKKQLETFVAKYDAKIETLQEAENAKAQRDTDAKVGELKTEWGQAWDKNVALARAAAKKFGIEGEKLNALEFGVGFVPMMKVLAEIGENISEDGFVAGSGGSGSSVRTPKQAMTELKEIQSDPDYLDNRKNPNRHKMLREKARDLYAMAYPSSSD